MTPEEKIKDFKGAKLIYYRTTTVALNFKDSIDIYKFNLWLGENGYLIFVTDFDKIEFTKIPIHSHRIEDARKYPNLSFQGSETVKS